MRKLIIAIDGPSGVGKSSLGKALAGQLSYQYIDSGAVYRAVGSLTLDYGIPFENTTAIAGLAAESSIRLEGGPDNLRVLVNGADVTNRIRQPDASRAASVVAAIPAVREAVVIKLREMSHAGGIVMDGRDIGAKVFPEADLKIFLDASSRVRAQRRWQEERLRGRQVTVDQTLAEIEERDRRDTERAATPLVKAPDAIALDTSDKSLNEVIEAVLEIVKTKG